MGSATGSGSTWFTRGSYLGRPLARFKINTELSLGFFGQRTKAMAAPVHHILFSTLGFFFGVLVYCAEVRRYLRHTLRVVRSEVSV